MQQARAKADDAFDLDTPDGPRSREGVLHLAVKEILLEERRMRVPAVTARVVRPGPGGTPCVVQGVDKAA